MSSSILPAISSPRSVALVTLGCARNEVDSEELAGRLAAAGWLLVDDAAQADVAVINTCGFVQQAKKDSIDALLEASDLKGSGRTQKVVAVGCLAERYGEQLAAELPEADAVLGFDSYADMSSHLTSILDGHTPASHVPSDRRRLLPLSPASRQATASSVALPGHGRHDGPEVLAGTAPEGGTPADGLFGGAAPASGPRVIRARLDGRPWAPLKIASGCDRRCAFCAIPMFRGSFVSRRPADILAEARWLGIERVRVSYLQPAEIRMDLLDVMASTPGVVPYFDISFQHASERLLRTMRRFGSPQAFLELVGQIRERAPLAGIRSNVIVGFPGETQADLDELEVFLTAARLDVVGVDGTDEDTDELTGRAAHQGPDVDGATLLRMRPGARSPAVGEIVAAMVLDTEGIDLVAEPE